MQPVRTVPNPLSDQTSALWDLPTGASVVAALGFVFAVSLGAAVVLRE